MNWKSIAVSMATMMVLTLSGALGAAAQGATPGADAMGYPELKVTITDQAVELSTQEVPAGYVILTVTNSAKQEFGAGVIGPEPGKSIADLQQTAATPTAENEFPAFLLHAPILGGTSDVAPGGTLQMIVNVPAGDWAVFSDGPQESAPFKATEGTATAEEPRADVTVTEQEFAFLGLDKPLPAGKQVWKVVNKGKQPHMLVLGKLPDGTTLDQVMQAVSRGENATPAPGELQESDVNFSVGGVLLQSTDTTAWPVLDLKAGTYVALCFVPDPDHGGVPHAMEGMVSVFQVGS
jgi:hypothetical protein